MDWLDDLSQVVILVSCVIGTWFLGRKEKWMRWGYIFCMIAQPFWLYSTYIHKTWGMFILCIWTTYTWGQGVYNYWIKKGPTHD